jgi:hypothetical protein
MSPVDVGVPDKAIVNPKALLAIAILTSEIRK